MAKEVWSEFPLTQDVVEENLFDIRNLIRNARLTETNAVVTDRGYGKTTALIQYIVERTFILPPKAVIGVVVPNFMMGEQFKQTFHENFPTTKTPLVSSAEEVLRGAWDGKKPFEVYVEEMFQIPCDQYYRIKQQFKVITGVGTINHPVAINVSSW